VEPDHYADKSSAERWDEAFEAMAAQGDDAPLFPEELEHSFDWTEWKW
jgi:hypothetical protein